MSKFGVCYHFDLHSMPQRAVKNMKNIPDIVLGDNFRKSCSLELINYIKDQFEKHGLIVSINQPYAGGFITRNYGNPSKGIETIQIEVNRSLYMDENKLLLKNIEPIQKIFSEIFNFFLIILKCCRIDNHKRRFILKSLSNFEFIIGFSFNNSLTINSA